MHNRVLDDSLGFALGVTYRKISGLLAARLRSLGLTTEQWSVLARTAEREGQIQKEIAERACKDKPTTTRILDSLEAKGLIEKQAGEHDRRSFVIRLTEEGRKIYDLAAPIERDTMKDISEGLSQDKLWTRSFAALTIGYFLFTWPTM